MRMENPDEGLATFTQQTECGRQKCRIDLVRRFGSQCVFSRNEAACLAISAHQQAAGFVGKSRSGMVDHAVQKSGINCEVHGNIFPGFRMLFGSRARLIRFIASIEAPVSARLRNSDFMMPIPCSPEIVPPISTASSKIRRFTTSAESRSA